MIFPWICLSVNKKQTFSDLINKCYSSNIRYLSVEEEKQLTKHAIKIVIDSQNKKQAMLAAKKLDDEIPAETSVLKNENKSMKKRGSVVNTSLRNSHNASQVSSQNEMGKQNVFRKPQQKLKELTNSKYSMPSIKNKSTVSQKNMALNNNESMKGPMIMDSPSKIRMKKQGSSNAFITGINRSQLNSALDIKNSSLVSQVLERSQFWEDRLTSQTYKPEIKQILIKGQNSFSQASSLSLLNNALNAYTNKEVDLLERKNTQLIKEYNDLFAKSKQKKRILEHVRQCLGNLPSDKEINQVDEKHELEGFNDDISNLDQSVENANEQRNRTIRIIEICELNSIQNEEWIRNLQFYLTNMRKAIKFLKEEIGSATSDTEQYTKLCEQFIKSYNQGVKNHMRLLKNIERSITNQRHVDTSIKNTNDMIYNSVLAKQKADEEKVQREQKKLQQNKNIALIEKKKAQVSHELDERKQDFEALQEIFQNCKVTGASWEKKPRFAKLLESLEKKEDLARYEIDVMSRVGELKQKLDRLRRYSHTVDLAQVEERNTTQVLDIPTYQNEIISFTEDNKKLKNVIEEKAKNHTMQSDSKAAWNLFLELIAYRINDDKFNKVIDHEIVVENCKKMIAKIEANGTQD